MNRPYFKENKSKRLVLAFTAILAVISMLAFFKYTILQGFVFHHMTNRAVGASEFIFIIGISYSSFKMMHFVIESYKDKINGLDYLKFLNYIFFFPAFISGPINRYNQFSKQLDMKLESSINIDLRKGAERVLHGIFKKFVLCIIVYPYALVNMPGPMGELSAFKI